MADNTQTQVTTIAELFKRLATNETDGENVKRVEQVFGLKIKDVLTAELFNYMGETGLELEGGVTLLSLDEVCDYNPSAKIIPMFRLPNNILICYDGNAKNYCKLNTRNGKVIDAVPSVNVYFREELEDMDEETTPDGENVSIPFIMNYKDTQVVVVFGYDMCKDKQSSFFAVRNIIVEYDEYEESFDCNIRVPINAKKWQEVYSPVLDTYKQIGNNPKAIAELDKFLKTDMTNPVLRNKYKKLIDFMEKEETDLMTAHSIIASDIELTEEQCYDIVHEYSNHARVAPLYEKVVEYVGKLELDM
ncbi:MAG: hypothetical protein E7354_05545 [Clostridiales bacterium]|nr:hypothetical protein [Clostridiales bacterium]